MTIGELIRNLKTYPLEMEIEIECPNGLLVEPKIKVYREDMLNWNKPLKYVLTGRE